MARDVYVCYLQTTAVTKLECLMCYMSIHNTKMLERGKNNSEANSAAKLEVLKISSKYTRENLC